MKTSKAFTEGRHLGGNLHCLIEFERIDGPNRGGKTETAVAATDSAKNGVNEAAATDSNPIAD